MGLAWCESGVIFISIAGTSPAHSIRTSAMPLAHRIEPHDRVVIVILAGTVSLEDILAWRDVVFGEPSSMRRFCQLVDTTRAIDVNVSLQTLARFASTSFFEPKTARAYLATRGPSMEVASLLSTISAAHEYETAIFTDSIRAHGWLTLQRERSDFRWWEQERMRRIAASP